MTKTIIATLVALTLTTSVAIAAGGNPGKACRDGTAPEGWKRAGGFCELAEKGPETTSHPENIPPVVVLP